MNFRSLRFAALIPVSLASLAACSSDGRDDTAPTSDDALIGAPLDHTHKFAVGVCAGPLSDGATDDEGVCLQAGTRCTGTLVAPNLILTARHCVRQIAYSEGGFCDGKFTDEALSDAPIRVTLSDSVKVGEPKWLAVKELLLPRTDNSCADDIALLILESSVPRSQARPVKMAVTRSLVANPPEEVAVVGRGVVSEVLDLKTWEMTQEDGELRRRIATNIPFTCATNDPAGCRIVDYSSPPKNEFDSPPGYFVIGNATASGDSGAGVIDQAEFATNPRVIGVNSAGTYGPDGKPNHGLVVRLDKHQGFLTLGLLKAAAASLGWSVTPAFPPSDDYAPDTNQ